MSRAAQQKEQKTIEKLGEIKIKESKGFLE